MTCILQVGEDASQLLPWSSHDRVTDWSPVIDFEATAHVVRQLDLVISVDTAVAHLAAGMEYPRGSFASKR